jgi:hypothetical protein
MSVGDVIGGACGVYKRGERRSFYGMAILQLLLLASILGLVSSASYSPSNHI